MTRLALALLGLLLLLGGVQAREQPPAAGPHAHVVVTLGAPPLARAPGSAARLNREQAAFEQALAAIPGARVHWRYRLVANGASVVLPRAAVPKLASLPGVRAVTPAARYGPSLDRSARLVRAPALWNGTPSATGEGVKIAVIDDGIDRTHPFFDPSGYAYPPGYPLGQRGYTTPKVIVARAFAPPGTTYRNARLPFDPEQSGHGTHVAGIAAGNAATPTGNGGPAVSGIAPRAYLGNYKALGIPTDAGVGLDGNSPELVAAIEAAVADGMDVINLSIGEPEIEPGRDVVALALDAAAAAGVVGVVAAGNDQQDYGRGSVTSPGSSAEAITVGATTTSSPGPEDVVAGFSSVGPTPVSLRLKPDVSAPGVAILSAEPGRRWTTMSGTSMAAPHVSGGVALLRQLHPDWSPRQVKGALVATARRAWAGPGRTVEASPLRAGTGIVDLVAAATPLLVPFPASLSFGALRGGDARGARVLLEDAGGGAGTWTVTVETRSTAGDAVLLAPDRVVVPGPLDVAAELPSPADGELTGTIVLRRGTDVRRVPFFAMLTAPTLGAAKVIPGPGTYRGDTRGRPRRAFSYRYPEPPPGGPLSATLAGPEQAFRLRITRPVANFGVVVTSRRPGVTVEPRVVVAGDESRLTGYPALPINLNPYLRQFGSPVLAAGAVRPAPGSYDLVFDSRSPAGAGRFTFRVWVGDVTPPRATLVARSVPRGTALRIRLSDAGAGVDPATLIVSVDGVEQGTRLRAGVVSVATAGLGPGRHRLRLQVSDYQESRNMENVAAILPNTRVLATTFTVRR